MVVVLLLWAAGAAHKLINSTCRPGFVFCLCQPCCLQQLTLHSVFLSEVPDAHLLTAITASTQLRLLSVSEGGHDHPATSLPLPKDALLEMFEPPKQWPYLQVGA
jgi:hypothetical protein